MANASTLSLTGVLLGSTLNRNWYLIPGIVSSFLLWHAIQGWCPPLPILRRLGYRTRKEIDTEKYALKALRGDFTRLNTIGTKTNEERIDLALQVTKQ
ncbi:hypothetical protein Q0590_22300 [Rhodocytophaga aerolata]|uniref:DUF2892 domain-containing protein n=1 Tax=Rhodocytophaga aerolata TaxID=455078 RepID=A0ABT8RAA6_9BACT|nr:hypothetical protein [Rhodocytophaga aerolata]MDO1449026.1 hypothetical protein [Rhodocytophaga aerolata]